MMLKCVSLAIYYHVKNRDYEVHLLDIFDEQLHPLSKDKVPDNYNRLNPEHKHIYRFIKTLPIFVISKYLAWVNFEDDYEILL